MKTNNDVLVIDDQPNWRELTQEILTNMGYNVTVGSNFEEGKDLLRSKIFDLAIFDMRLIDEQEYNVQGIKLIQEAKKLQPHIKAIILTGYPDNQQKKAALKIYNADGYLEKAPESSSLKIRNFIQAISEILDA